MAGRQPWSTSAAGICLSCSRLGLLTCAVGLGGVPVLSGFGGLHELRRAHSELGGSAQHPPSPLRSHPEHRPAARPAPPACHQPPLASLGGNFPAPPSVASDGSQPNTSLSSVRITCCFCSSCPHNPPVTVTFFQGETQLLSPAHRTLRDLVLSHPGPSFFFPKNIV